METTVCDGCEDVENPLYKCNTCTTSELYCYDCATEHYMGDHFEIEKEFHKTNV